MGISRAFIYGDLLIETVAIIDGSVRFAPLHFKRLTAAAAVLNFQLPEHWSLDYFIQLVAAQCPEKNMRARLITSRSGNGFYLSNTNEVTFHVDYWTLPKSKTLINEVGIYRDQLKACSSLSNLKSGNALIYVLASQHAAAMGWDDVLILNTNGRIAEASSSNVFWIKSGLVYTPPLNEGPVEGVMREALFIHLRKQGLSVEEKALDQETLLAADECFLTNSLNPLVSIKTIATKTFETGLTDVIRKEFTREWPV